jgi:hypothetical protein
MDLQVLQQLIWHVQTDLGHDYWGLKAAFKYYWGNTPPIRVSVGCDHSGDAFDQVFPLELLCSPGYGENGVEQ